MQFEKLGTCTVSSHPHPKDIHLGEPCIGWTHIPENQQRQHEINWLLDGMDDYLTQLKQLMRG